jgi:ADP-ribosylarginine hydrolase
MRGMLHGGDNDSTGTIAGAWYGAMKGFDGVFEKNYMNIEDKELL